MLGLWSLLLLWGLATPCQGLLETVGTLARIDKDELGKAIQNSLVGGPILQNVLGSVTAVNQGLLGSGGLLGGGGLLGHGGVFGVVEELSGLKIEELTLPKESLKLLPGFGVQLNLHTKVGMHCSGWPAEVKRDVRVHWVSARGGMPPLISSCCSTLLGPHQAWFLGLSLQVPQSAGSSTLQTPTPLDHLGTHLASPGSPELPLQPAQVCWDPLHLRDFNPCSQHMEGPTLPLTCCCDFRSNHVPHLPPPILAFMSIVYVELDLMVRKGPKNGIPGKGFGLLKFQWRNRPPGSRTHTCLPLLRLLPTPLFGVVEQMLFKVLPGLLCPVVDSVLGVVNELLGTVLGLVPLGALGSLEFSLATLPLISNQYIELDINPIVKSVAGDIIDFPKSPAPAKVPPKEDHTSQVTVPLYLFNTMFGLLQTNGALDMDITPELVPSDVPLTTTDLAALLPEALGKLPLHQHLLLSLRVKEAPTVTLNNKKALVSLPANIHVLSYVPQGTPESLLELNSVMTLRAQLTPSATKLHISLCLERLSVKVASSFTYAFDESRLEEWLSHVVRVVYAPKLNVALDVGIPLPKVLNISFSSSVLEIIENAVVLTVPS
ncbi:PREDICTED: BPI fold-containing family B member 3 [Cercocebus atys]|uniref:BPI fold-containing family B member 3 n=1 Tax=Cercocebus atys TaxID=9531 RepID=UPI0005F546B5|nr:PREDICTED: BPI fold-containing family B member 3 [Cercocebus atys]